MKHVSKFLAVALMTLSSSAYSLTIQISPAIPDFSAGATEIIASLSISDVPPGTIGGGTDISFDPIDTTTAFPNFNATVNITCAGCLPFVPNIDLAAGVIEIDTLTFGTDIPAGEIATVTFSNPDSAFTSPLPLFLSVTRSPWTTLNDGPIPLADITLIDAAVIPVPAAVWLFGTGLLGLVAVARRKASSTA